MRGLGYFLGYAFGAILLFSLISYIFLGPRNVSNKQVGAYIDNSEKILITHPIPLVSEYDGDDKRLGRETLSKITFFSNRNMQYLRAFTYTYFSKELNKYVRSYVINGGGASTEDILDFGYIDKDTTKYPDLYFYYNKAQNADPTYGTLEKPLPILHYRSSDIKKRAMRPKTSPAYLQKVYEANVRLYLEYFIEKEDFKKLFPED